MNMIRRPAARRSIDLEDLVSWAYRQERVDHAADALLHEIERAACGCEHRASSRDGIAALERRARLGCRITGGVIPGVSSPVHPDAEAVHDAVLRLAAKHPNRMALVVQHAKLGERPEISTVEPELVPVRSRKAGKDGVEANAPVVTGEWETVPPLSDMVAAAIRLGIGYGGRKKFGRQMHGFKYRTVGDGVLQVRVRWCPVELSPDPEWTRFVNAVYGEWHAGMMALLGALLDADLRGHRLTGFAAPIDRIKCLTGGPYPVY